MSGVAHPLVSLPPSLVPAFQLKVIWYGPAVRTVSEPKRFKVSATIQIEGDVTAEELRELFLPAERLGGRVSINTRAPEELEPAPAESEEDARKRLLNERRRHLVEAYREKLGEPSDQLLPALGAWLSDFGEDVIRRGITETAVAGIPGQQARYEYLRAWLRTARAAQRRERP